MKEQAIRELDSENYALRTYSIQLEGSVEKFNDQYNLLLEENQALRSDIVALKEELLTLRAAKPNRDMGQIEAKASELFNHLHVFLLGNQNYTFFSKG
jgi:hypothetical protein